MTVGRYILGCAELVAIVAPLVWAAARWHNMLYPRLRGPAALLGGAILVLAALTVESELLGSVDGLRAGWLILASLAVGAAATVVPRRRGEEAPSRDGWGRDGTTTAVLVISVGLIAFEQLVHTWLALRGGIAEFDSLTYHLPTAARWIQTGSLLPPHQIYPGSLFAYYPYNAELLHAVGMAAFGTDLLSPVLNLGFVALILLAAWCIGAVRGAGAHAVAAVTALLTTWGFYILGGGTALNDLPSIAFVLAAIACVAWSQGGAGESFLAALAGGLAIGTKPNTALVVVIVGIGAVWVTSRRGRSALVWLAGLLLGGGYWYLRDLIWVGTPSPGLSLGFLPTPTAFPWPLTFVHALRTGIDTAGSLTGGLHIVLGPAWPIICALALAGVVLGLWRGRLAWERAAAIGTVANLAAWPFSPFTEVVQFAVRYAGPGLAIGLILFATTPKLAPGVRRTGLLVFLLGVSAVNLLHLRPGSLPYSLRGLAAAVIVAGLVLLFRYFRPARGVAFASAAALTIVVIVVGWPIGHGYVNDRYQLDRFVYTGPDALALRRVFSWAQGLHGQRIGVDGGELQYPLYGTHLSNYVQYIGLTEPSGGFARIESCRRWRAAITAGRYDYVITVPWGSESNSPALPSPQGAWTASDPAASVVMSPGSGITVFAIRSRMHPSAC